MIALSSSSIDPVALGAEFLNGLAGAGAVATFTGLVRPEGGKQVEALFIDHAAGITEPAIEGAVAEAKRRWPLIAVSIAHRIGRVPAGEPVVFVATAAEHRRAAFEACDFLMDYLKTDAPFWKKQISRSGDEWIEPRAEDYTDSGRWR
ncbi:MAG: molybdenum cofactor biosynthesis protein MoaE [Pseudomonadota bacterium]|mgnify:CR=1 FL=1